MLLRELVNTTPPISTRSISSPITWAPTISTPMNFIVLTVIMGRFRVRVMVRFRVRVRVSLGVRVRDSFRVRDKVSLGS